MMKSMRTLAQVCIVLGVTLGCAPGLYAQGYGDGDDYYPHYAPPPPGYYRGDNPTVSRDYYTEGDYAPDGTYHSELVEEDRRASYYSPGRNQAITRPRTTVESWRNGPDEQTTREHTSWIGADGRPHSTTIERNTVVDDEGNSHTDTYVTLQRAGQQGVQGSGGHSGQTPGQTQPTRSTGLPAQLPR